MTKSSSDAESTFGGVDSPVGGSGSARGDGPAHEGERRVRRHVLKARQVTAIVVAAVMVVAVVVSCVWLIQLGVLPPKFLWPIVAADVIVAVVLAICLLTTGRHGHRVRYWISLVLAVLLAAANIGVVYVESTFKSTMDHIQPSQETELYDVVDLATQPNNLAFLIGAEVAADKTDGLYNAVVSAAQQVVSVTVVPVSGQDAVIASVTSGQYKGAILMTTTCCSSKRMTRTRTPRSRCWLGSALRRMTP